ncbi:hypothetical protein CANARDRAFT_26581 [[Candida] arabinofermentans NRRL YB-2248]|uniref:Uncharacterized protein n=1 Tax=[Candida] arabinofermentans NRRL YB-2248 TaxID=983967 RepID=A0A1E4T661_9ASCO|nr:hypothetical protein CANARDRAFT_26581 [[Candida] arabinofermentans NRRL YB-2248]
MFETFAVPVRYCLQNEVSGSIPAVDSSMTMSNLVRGCRQRTVIPLKGRNTAQYTVRGEGESG